MHYGKETCPLEIAFGTHLAFDVSFPRLTFGTSR